MCCHLAFNRNKSDGQTYRQYNIQFSRVFKHVKNKVKKHTLKHRSLSSKLKKSLSQQDHNQGLMCSQLSHSNTIVTKKHNFCNSDLDYFCRHVNKFIILMPTVGSLSLSSGLSQQNLCATSASIPVIFVIKIPTHLSIVFDSCQQSTL